jgi:hypothetical protein
MSGTSVKEGSQTELAFFRARLPGWKAEAEAGEAATLTEAAQWRARQQRQRLKGHDSETRVSSRNEEKPRCHAVRRDKTGEEKGEKSMGERRGVSKGRIRLVQW